MRKARLAPDADWLRLLGEILRDARLREGLSVRACAARLGLSPQTIANAEQGGDTRASTLARYLESLPGLTPAGLLALPTTGVRAATRAAWQAHRDLCGYGAERALVRVHALCPGRASRLLVVRGLRSVHASMADVAVRAALCRIASDAHSRSLPLIGEGEPGTTGRLVDENGVHAWRIPEDLDEGITCWSHRIVGDSDWPGWVSALAVENLELRLHGPLAAIESLGGGHVGCWPISTPAEAESDIADALYPDRIAADTDAGGHALVARIVHPAPLVHHVLVPGPAPAGDSRRGSVAERVRARRTELGLGLRDAARRIHASHVTLDAVERGVDAGALTLRRIVTGLGIPVEQVLPPGLLEGAEGLHDWLRCLHGVEATAIVKTLVVHPDGMAASRIETRGLKSLRPDAGSLRLRLGLARAALQLHPDLLDEIEADGDLRLKIVRRQRGSTQHELRFPGGEALGRGISYTRRLAPSKQFAMTLDEARVMFGGADFCEFGTSLPVFHPAEELRLIVRFPLAFRPLNLRPHVWTLDMVPDPMAPRIVGAPFLKVAVGRTDRHLVASLVVRRPLVGFKYGIGWTVGS